MAEQAAMFRLVASQVASGRCICQGEGLKERQGETIAGDGVE
jgi:hypothetical protein